MDVLEEQVCHVPPGLLPVQQQALHLGHGRLHGVGDAVGALGGDDTLEHHDLIGVVRGALLNVTVRRVRLEE